jgi:hypothetical protein
MSNKIEKWLKISLIALKGKVNIIEFENNKFEFKIFKYKELNNKGTFIIWNLNRLNAFSIMSININESILAEVIEISLHSDSNLRFGMPENLIFENSKPY